MGELSGAITSTGKVFMFPTVKLATRAIKKVIIRLGPNASATSDVE